MPDEYVNDLLVEIYPDQKSAGGQHVGVPRGIKITHVPSGLVAICECERSQFHNLAVAKEMILGGITSKYFSS